MWLDTIVAQFAFGLHNLEQIVRASTWLQQIKSDSQISEGRNYGSRLRSGGAFLCCQRL